MVLDNLRATAISLQLPYQAVHPYRIGGAGGVQARKVDQHLVDESGIGRRADT